jgi:predicted MPP superfamily phosphohydrolase
MTRKRRLFVAAGTVALGLVGLAFWALWIEPRRLVVRNVSLALPHWPEQSAGMRIVLLSDLHVGSPHWGPSRIRELVDTANAEHPDLILLAGDYVIDGVAFGTKVDVQTVADLLGHLRAPLGVIAVLGNHDGWNDGDRVRRALEARGLVVLENRAQAVSFHGHDVYIAGIADMRTRTPRVKETLATVPEGAPILVLVHEPDLFPSVDARVSLTLAGHTHGGQVKLPFVGRLVVPSDYGQRFAAGHVEDGGRHMFVTTGVGTSIFPIRFGVPPELVVLTLR